MREGREAGMNEAHGRRVSKRAGRSALSKRDAAKALGREISERLNRLARLLAEARGFGATESIPLDAVELHLKVPLTRKGGHHQAGVDLTAALDDAIATGLRAAGAFEIGRVHCFLCDSSSCEHSVPVERTATFTGYAPNGKPQWKSFINVCIERKDERVDRLYGAEPDVIALVQEPDELSEGLMPRFGKEDRAYGLLGQVVVGLLPPTLDRRVRSGTRIALTLQLVETQGRGGARRIRLNVLGIAPDAIAEAAALGGPKGPAEALRRTLVSVRERVDALGRQQGRAVRQSESLDLEGQALPILRKLRTDIERIFRSSKRRTGHAEGRHNSGERPTGDAMNDVVQASPDQFFHDTRRNTVVVLGARGRAHVFTAAGQHVTSLRLDPGELKRKTERQRWTPLDPEAAASLKTRLATLPGA
jgi:hypothetical protein